MDIEKALLDQNLVLGEIKGAVIAVRDLQTIANGRTGKTEARVDALEKENDKRLKDLETAKSIQDGEMRAIKWVWTGIIFVVGITEFIILKIWK